MTRLLSLSIGVGIAVAAPATAAAASLDANGSCYFNKNLARLSGSGFAPDSSVVFTVNGKRINQSVMTDSEGTLLVRYDPPRTETERKLIIKATDSDDTTARTTIYVTRKRRVTADPDSSANVRTWEAVLQLFGFGRGRAFIHYLNPNDRLKKTVRLGRLQGPCGRLKTDKRRVMPFDDPQFGVWHLQFDVRRRYDRDIRRRRVIPVRVFHG